MLNLKRSLVLAAYAIALATFIGCPAARQPQAGDTRAFDGIEFQWCPPGTFAMGSPSSELGHESDEDLHEVTLTKGFWLSTFEITQSQWESIVGSNPSLVLGDDLPVEQVSWEDVQEFLIVLNANTTGATYRLPTEAEWEYACRAGSTTRFYWGEDNDESEIGTYAWYEENSESATHAAGQKEPNAFGLYDMTGNVQEWCQDLHGEYPPGPVTDPTGSELGSGRVIRGGAYSDSALLSRAANRSKTLSIVYMNNLGFRLVRTQD
ncbi:MAG: formylglycine-generating enzyme family protein [Candidatus Hydrogenedentes bacterium]|nr:formylglycine-generating enzyme family protein [Candidatus Hydrogenedentota bacterium]